MDDSAKVRTVTSFVAVRKHAQETLTRLQKAFENSIKGDSNSKEYRLYGAALEIISSSQNLLEFAYLSHRFRVEIGYEKSFSRAFLITYYGRVDTKNRVDISYYEIDNFTAVIDHAGNCTFSKIGIGVHSADEDLLDTYMKVLWLTHIEPKMR